MWYRCKGWVPSIAVEETKHDYTLSIAYRTLKTDEDDWAQQYGLVLGRKICWFALESEANKTIDAFNYHRYERLYELNPLLTEEVIKSWAVKGFLFEMESVQEFSDDPKLYFGTESNANAYLQKLKGMTEAEKTESKTLYQNLEEFGVF